MISSFYFISGRLKNDNPKYKAYISAKTHIGSFLAA